MTVGVVLTVTPSVGSAAVWTATQGPPAGKVSWAPGAGLKTLLPWPDSYPLPHTKRGHPFLAPTVHTAPGGDGSASGHTPYPTWAGVCVLHC